MSAALRHVSKLNVVRNCERGESGTSRVLRRVAGIISARNNYKRRQAVRDAWADASQVKLTWPGPLHSSLSVL